MTNAMFIIGSGDNLARGRERCVGDLGPGTKAISRPDPNTAATFLSQNDDKKDEMDGRSDGCSGGYGGGGHWPRRQPPTTKINGRNELFSQREFRVGG